MLKHKFDIQINPRLDGEPRFWAMWSPGKYWEGWHGRVLCFHWFWERRSKPQRG